MKYALAMMLVIGGMGGATANADGLIIGGTRGDDALGTMITSGDSFPICGVGDFEGPCRTMATADEYIRLRNICLSVPQCAAKLAAEK